MMLLNTWSRIVQWLQGHMLQCPVKSTFHIDCPGCGMQRSFISLLQGNLTASLHYHPGTIPMLALFLFLALHLIVRFRHGGKILVTLQLIVAVVSISFYVYKIIKH